MNEFLYLVVGLSFGAGGAYLFATLREFNDRRPRVLAAWHALQELQCIWSQTGLPPASPASNWAKVATFITDEYCKVTTREEKHLMLGSLQERA